VSQYTPPRIKEKKKLKENLKDKSKVSNEEKSSYFPFSSQKRL
jgi:hypothetical protein